MHYNGRNEIFEKKIHGKEVTLPDNRSNFTQGSLIIFFGIFDKKIMNEVDTMMRQQYRLVWWILLSKT